MRSISVPSFLGAALLGGIAALAPTLVSAQSTYPNKPVRFITASTGSPQDVVGRLFAQKLGETWGQAVVVDNRAGAGSLLSIQATVQAPADGYSVLIASAAYAVTPFLYQNPGFDAEKDLVPVALLASTPNIIVTAPGSGIKTLKEAVERVRQGKELRYGSPGFGTTPQLSADYLFKVLAKTEVTHVPYKGIPPLMQGTLAGEVEIASAALPPAVPLIKTGRLIGLAVTSATRSPALPDVPTIAEAGFTGFEDESWVGVWVPARTPATVIARLREQLAAVGAMADLREKLRNVGFEVSSMSGEAFQTLVNKELRKWARVIKETGTKVE